MTPALHAGKRPVIVVHGVQSVVEHKKLEHAARDVARVVPLRPWIRVRIRFHPRAFRDRFSLQAGRRAGGTDKARREV